MMTPSTMTKGSNDRSKSTARKAVYAIAALMAFSLLLVPAIVTASVSATPNSELAGNARCLKCHSRNLKKALEDGGTLSLHVEQDELASSAHSKIPCTGCHKAIAGKRHPAKEKISSERAFSLDKNQICAGCHAGKFTQYKGSIHASLVAEGSVTAPLCTDCHSAHDILPVTR